MSELQFFLAFVHYYWFFVLPFANAWTFTRRSEQDEVDYVAACYVAEVDQLQGRIQ